MRGFRRQRLVFIATLSLALHAIALVWLGWPTEPTLLATGPDLSLMSVELFRPATPEPARTRSAEPIAATREVASASPVAPLEVIGPVAPVGVPTSANPAAPDTLRAALRAGAGCSRAVTREAREACAETLGRLAPGTPSYDAPMDPGKRAYYDAVVAAGASGGTYGDPQPGAVTPGGAAYFRFLNCSVKFGGGRKSKDRQGEVRLGRTPCSIPLQGSFVTPEASVRKR
jgi:hypothetical protein